MGGNAVTETSDKLQRQISMSIMVSGSLGRLLLGKMLQKLSSGSLLWQLSLGISGFLILGTFRISASGKLAVRSLSSQSFRMAFSGNPRLSLPLLIAESPENYKHIILFKDFKFSSAIKSSYVANTQFLRKKRKHSTL